MMRLIYSLFLIILSPLALADVATYSTSDQTLNVPILVINGTIYYQDVKITLDNSSGNFTLMGASKIDAVDIPPQTVTLTDDAPGILFTNDTLTLLYIEDSRCPTGAQCIVAGQVSIGIQLKDHLTDGLTVMELQLEGNGSILSDEVKTEEYIFRLLDASPYPVLDTTLDDSDYSFNIEYSLNPD